MVGTCLFFLFKWIIMNQNHQHRFLKIITLRSKFCRARTLNFDLRKNIPLLFERAVCYGKVRLVTLVDKRAQKINQFMLSIINQLKLKRSMDKLIKLNFHIYRTTY